MSKDRKSKKDPEIELCDSMLEEIRHRRTELKRFIQAMRDANLSASEIELYEKALVRTFDQEYNVYWWRKILVARRVVQRRTGLK